MRTNVCSYGYPILLAFVLYTEFCNANNWLGIVIVSNSCVGEFYLKAWQPTITSTCKKYIFIFNSYLIMLCFSFATGLSKVIIVIQELKILSRQISYSFESCFKMTKIHWKFTIYVSIRGES